MFDTFTTAEKKQLTFYILGIMLYKFALETMNACISGIILNRLPLFAPSVPAGVIWGTMQNINLFAQCLGSLLIGPLVARFPAGRILSLTILLFGITISGIVIIEAATGGRIPGIASSDDASYWGHWNPLIMFAFFSCAGVFHGMIELMRRVIPNDIVGGDATKLREMDALVHIFYEVTGTIGAALSVYWISFFGWAYALLIMPSGFCLAALFWSFLGASSSSSKQHIQRDGTELTIYSSSSSRDFSSDNTLLDSSETSHPLPDQKTTTTTGNVGQFVSSFWHSVKMGGTLLFSQRALIWLLPSYTLPLVLHRYLESTLFPFYAKDVLGNSNLQTTLTTGSNAGELIGALMVLLVAKRVKTPIPFLRADAILLLLIWILPFVTPESTGLDPSSLAIRLTPMMAAISLGWACGDVSLAAYVQSRLDGHEDAANQTSPLASVMSFLYASYLITYFILNTCMSLVRDAYRPTKDYRTLFIWIGGVLMTSAGVIVFASTFIPRGAFAWNPEPDTLVTRDPDSELSDEDHEFNRIPSRRAMQQQQHHRTADEIVTTVSYTYEFGEDGKMKKIMDL